MKQFTGVNGFLYTAALIVGGLTALAPRASADTATVPFSAALGGGCFFGGITGGTVSQSGNNILLGENAVVPLTCTAGGTLTVADPVENPSNPKRADVKGAIVYHNTLGLVRSPSVPPGLFSNSITSMTIPANPTAYILNIAMGAQYNTGYGRGTYTYTVQLTATP